MRFGSILDVVTSDALILRFRAAMLRRSGPTKSKLIAKGCDRWLGWKWKLAKIQIWQVYLSLIFLHRSILMMSRMLWNLFLNLLLVNVASMCWTRHSAAAVDLAPQHTGSAVAGDLPHQRTRRSAAAVDLPCRCLEHPPTTRMHIAHSGWIKD